MSAVADYELYEEIGRSERTIVHRARDMNSQQQVAIKEIIETLRDDPDAQRDLALTLGFHANLDQYDHVVQVRTLIKEKNWLVMDYCETNLAARLKESPKGIPEDEVRIYLREALEGLESLHANDRYHGNLKPSNLLIHRGRLKLGDSTGLVVDGVARPPHGSKKYSAPELVGDFGDVGPWTDLYLIGFTTLELLVGARFDNQFKGTSANSADPETGWAMLHGSAGEGVQSVERIVPGLADDLHQVLNRLLKKDPSERFGSAVMALQMLNAPKKEFVEEKKKSKAVPIAIGAFALIGAAVIGLALMSPEDKPIVEVTSDPDGSKIGYTAPDGKLTYPEGKNSKTPAKFNFATARKVKFVIEKEGYEKFEQEIDSAKKEERKVFAKLKPIVVAVVPKVAKVEIKTVPDTAEFTIKGPETEKSAKGKLTLELAPGMYQIAAKVAGYLPKEETIQVEIPADPLSTRPITITLSKEPPKLASQEDLDGIDLLLRRNQTTQALRKTTELIVKFPEDDHLAAYKAIVLDWLAAEDADNLQDALKLIDELKVKNPEDKLILAFRAEILADLEKYPEALEDANKAVKLDRSWGRSYRNRGYVYEKMKRYDDAIKEYGLAIQAELEKAPGFYFLERGALLKEKKTIRQAIADFEEAIKRDENLLIARLGLADCLRVDNHLDEAEKVLKEAFNRPEARSLNPLEMSKFRYLYGQVFMDRKKYAEALREYEEAYRLSPMEKKYFKERGRAAMRLFRNQDIEADKLGPYLDDLKKLKSDNQFTPRELEEVDRAIRDMEDFLKKKPKGPIAPKKKNEAPGLDLFDDEPEGKTPKKSAEGATSKKTISSLIELNIIESSEARGKVDLRVVNKLDTEIKGLRMESRNPKTKAINKFTLSLKTKAEKTRTKDNSESIVKLNLNDELTVMLQDYPPEKWLLMKSSDGALSLKRIADEAKE
jgi:serine/threonine protein kinase/tetratricopeptide (TPR) repeat protein